MAGTGGAVAHEGLASHVYVANSSMEKKAFVNSDGDMLIIPQQGRLDIQTELGRFVGSKPGMKSRLFRSFRQAFRISWGNCRRSVGYQIQGRSIRISTCLRHSTAFE